VLPAVIVVTQASCNMLVSTDGLTGNGGSTTTDAGSCPSCTADATSPATDAAPPLTDASSPTDATATADVASPSDGSAQDSGGSVLDARADAPLCVPPLSGLLAYYTMDADSIAGTTLIDGSGNANDGTLVGFGSSVTAPGKFGQALAYPSTADAYVNIPVLPLDTTSGDANSISLWFYRDGPGVNDVLALLPNSPRYDLWLTGSPDDASTDTYLCIDTEHNDCFGVGSTNLLGRWVHVVAVFVNGQVTMSALFVDGQPAGATCLTSAGFDACNWTATAAAPAQLGGKDSFFFHGMLDDVRVYDRALTASEVATLYACP
jgi:hypothetical protein